MSAPRTAGEQMWAQHAADASRFRRTPEAQADIAAARAAPTGLEVAMQELDRAAEQALHEHRNAPTAYRSPLAPDATARDQAIADLAHQPNRTLDGLLSNAALADTPAVRGMGGPAQNGAFPVDVKRITSGCKGCDALTWDVDNGKALILRGPALDRYLALEAAARNAHATAQAAKTAAAALMGAFQQLCAGFTGGKDG